MLPLRMAGRGPSSAGCRSLLGPSSHLTSRETVRLQSWFRGDRNWYAAYRCLEVDRFRASASHLVLLRCRSKVLPVFPTDKRFAQREFLRRFWLPCWAAGMLPPIWRRRALLRMYLEPRTVLGCGPVMSTWHLSIMLPVSIG